MNAKAKAKAKAKKSGRSGSLPPQAKKKHQAKADREGLQQQQRDRMKDAPDPLSGEALKKMGIRIGLILLVVWVVAIVIPHWAAKAVAGVITVGILGFAIWGLRFAKKNKAVASLVQGADTREARQEALEKLEADYDDDDTAAVFAKAQLLMQDDPRGALTTLEAVDLKKVMAPVADEARSQRAMIHLMLGETGKARSLADGIDLGRHKETRVKATLAGIIAESWARTGQARRATELLETFDLDDDEFEALRPQLFRSLAFAYAGSNQTKKMKHMLRKLRGINPQLLMGFITKKKNPNGVNPRGVHPLLEKEAFNMVMKSGAVPRKNQFRRA